MGDSGTDSASRVLFARIVGCHQSAESTLSFVNWERSVRWLIPRKLEDREQSFIMRFLMINVETVYLFGHLFPYNETLLPFELGIRLKG